MFTQTHRSSPSKHSSTTRRAVFESLEGRQLLSASPTLWADDSQGRLFTVTPSTGAVHVVGKMPAVMFDIAYDAHGNLYGVDSTSSLWKVNPANASATRLGAVGAVVNSLVFSTNGTLYAAGSALYKLSTANGHGTKIGSSLSGYTSAGDLAFDPSGNLYLSTNNNNDLVRVNVTTGAATNVGPIGFSQVYGMAFGPDGVLYGLSNATDQIFSINKTTGHGTLLSSFANKGVVGVNGSTFPAEAIATIEVDGNAVKIADGDTTPTTADGTSFGSVKADSATVTHTFTITNHTKSTLDLTSTPRVTISGTNAADFSVVTAPAQYVAPGASTSFTVKFTPHATGARSATITIKNDNANDPAYHFAVSGTGVATAPATGSILYAADSRGNLFLINSLSGGTYVIGHMARVMYDIAFNSAGALYGVDSSNEIWKINPTTAAISFVGSLSVSDSITSLTFSSSGSLYAAGSKLYRIDLSTGKYYTEGTLGGYTSAGDLAFDKYGDLVMTTTTNKLVKVNPTTAATTLIGSIGYSQVLGLAEGTDGVLYGMSDGTDEIFSVNPITGAAYNPVHFSGVYGVFGAAVYP